MKTFYQICILLSILFVGFAVIAVVANNQDKIRQQSSQPVVTEPQQPQMTELEYKNALLEQERQECRARFASNQEIFDGLMRAISQCRSRPGHSAWCSNCNALLEKSGAVSDQMSRDAYIINQHAVWQ